MHSKYCPVSIVSLTFFDTHLLVSWICGTHRHIILLPILSQLVVILRCRICSQLVLNRRILVSARNRMLALDQCMNTFKETAEPFCVTSVLTLYRAVRVARAARRLSVRPMMADVSSLVGCVGRYECTYAGGCVWGGQKKKSSCSVPIIVRARALNTSTLDTTHPRVFRCVLDASLGSASVRSCRERISIVTFFNLYLRCGCAHSVRSPAWSYVSSNSCSLYQNLHNLLCFYFVSS